jgi:acetyl esterase/lipase
MRALTWLMRRVVKPRLARTATPLVARAEFDRAIPLLVRRPPFLLRRVRAATGAAPEMHWIECGAPRRREVLLYVHGGAYFAGSPVTHEALAGRLCQLTGMRAVLPVYARVPEHPAPAAYDDVCRTYDALHNQGIRADDIVLGGDSAGGGLAMALLARLCREDARPAAAFAFSPWADLAMGSASLKTNAEADPLLPVSRMREVVTYVTGSGPEALAPNDPRLSPVYARFDAPPPVLIQVGTTEILRDDALRLAARLRQGGGRVELSQWPGAPHLWQILDGYLPEARAALAEAARFVTETLDARPMRGAP